MDCKIMATDAPSVDVINKALFNGGIVFQRGPRYNMFLHGAKSNFEKCTSRGNQLKGIGVPAKIETRYMFGYGFNVEQILYKFRKTNH